MENLKLKWNREEVDDLHRELRIAVEVYELKYITRKKAKGEEVDQNKLRNAMNQNKKLKLLTKLCLASTLSLGNILDKPAHNRLSEQLEREARQ